MSDLHRTTLEYAIINVLNAYHNIGGRHITAKNLPLAFTRLYNAIEALDTELTQQRSPRMKPIHVENPDHACPEHAPDNADIFNAWPCPDDCPQFIAELERRINDIQINGNYIRVWRDNNGQHWREEVTEHQPQGPVRCNSILGDATDE